MDEPPRTIGEAAEQIRRGEVAPTDLLEQCLARIDRYEPQVRAWQYLDRDRARDDARQRDNELKRGINRGPLHGIPVGIKDIIDVFDMPTGCGSKLWANSYARRDADCVARLREAGAVIVGKTVTTAFASFDPAVTRNPWDPTRTPGGSSSGSAAAVACGMCFAAPGSQTGGSITRPASYCGVASLKPSHGRVRVDGVLPLAPTLDHVGVMANCVRDLAIVYDVIWNEFSVSNGIATTTEIDHRLASTLCDVRSRLQRLHGLFDELMEPVMALALGHFIDGLLPLLSPEAQPIDVSPPAAFANVLRRHRVIMAVEAAQIHGERLARHPDDYPPRIRELIEEGLHADAVTYRDALENRESLVRELSPLAAYYLTPATPGIAPDASSTGNPACNSPWSYTGLPTVSFPIAYSPEGLPLSVQLVGGLLGETSLLATAAWAECAWSQCPNGFQRRPLPGS